MQCVWYIRYTIVDIDTPKGSSNSRRVLLVISPSLRVGPASPARGFRRTRQEAALLTPSPLRSSSSVPPPAPPRLGTPSRSVVGPGTPLPASSLAAATPAGISTPLHHQRARIFLAHVIWWRVPPLVQLNLEQVVQHQRVIRQRSQPRRTTCPPQRSSSSRLRAISSRPEPVR